MLPKHWLTARWGLLQESPGSKAMPATLTGSTAMQRPGSKARPSCWRSRCGAEAAGGPADALALDDGSSALGVLAAGALLAPLIDAANAVRCVRTS